MSSASEDDGQGETSLFTVTKKERAKLSCHHLTVTRRLWTGEEEPVPPLPPCPLGCRPGLDSNPLSASNLTVPGRLREHLKYWYWDTSFAQSIITCTPKYLSCVIHFYLFLINDQFYNVLINCELIILIQFGRKFLIQRHTYFCGKEL